jgi:hypothetical protein
LGFPEIKSGRKYFATLNLRTFHLAALVAVPFRKSFIFEQALCLLNMLDYVLLSIPFINRMAWVAVIEYRKPIKGSSQQ